MSEKNAKAKRKAKVIELEDRKKGMRFTAHQRITLIPMLPDKGSYFNIQKRREVGEALGLNDEEVKAAENTTSTNISCPYCNRVFPVSAGGGLNWKKVDQVVKAKHIEFGEWLTDKIKGQLKKLYDDEQLTDETIDLYDLFVGKKLEE